MSKPMKEMVLFLLGMLRTIEIENEGLRELLKENGVPDVELQAALKRKTKDPRVQKKVDEMTSPALSEMRRILGEIESAEVLEEWKPKGKAN